MNPKIVTLTFSPCIDKTTTVASLLPDIKMRCSAPTLQPGGGGINVARAIKKLGGDATAIYVSGGYTGQFFNHLIKQENIDAVVIHSEHETRENITLLDEAANKQYRFGMPLSPLTEPEWNEVLKALDAIDGLEFMVLSGSMPPNMPATMFAQIAAIAKLKEAKLVLDTSGEHLKQALEAGVYLIKPNLGELSILAGKERITTNEAIAVAKSFIAAGKCEVVAISMGAEGAMLVSANLTQQIKPPHVIRKSTVGAGDSMVAGIVFSLSQGKTLLEAVQYGVACGTAATLNPGTELCRKADADTLLLQLQTSTLG